MCPYEVLPHTADLKLRITAPDLGGLFLESVLAMFDVMLAREKVREIEEKVIRLAPGDPGLVLKDLLDEALDLFEMKEFAARSARLAGCVDEPCNVVLCGEGYDPRRHGRGEVIKAVTFHELEVVPIEGHWQAEVVFDL